MKYSIQIFNITCIILIIAVALFLKPDPRGFGTHSQLLILPCYFQATTGLPCPGCGLTTSFSHIAHGNIEKALLCNIFGPVLFLMMVIFGIYNLLYIITKGKIRLNISNSLQQCFLFSILIGFVINWFFKIYFIFKDNNFESPSSMINSMNNYSFFFMKIKETAIALISRSF